MPGTSNYPSSLDGTNLTEPVTGTDRSGGGLEDQRETNRLKVLVQAVKALEAKLGIGASDAAAATTGQVLTKQAAGTVTYATPAAGAALAATVTDESSYALAPLVGTSSNVAREDHGHGTPELTTLTETWAIGDASGNLAVAAGTFVWSPMREIQVIAVRAVLQTASSSGSVSVDVNTFEYATGTTTSILTASGGNLLVPAASRSAARNLSPFVSVVGSTHGLTVDVDAIGTGAKWLTVTIRHQEVIS